MLAFSGAPPGAGLNPLDLLVTFSYQPPEGVAVVELACELSIAPDDPALLAEGVRLDFGTAPPPGGSGKRTAEQCTGRALPLAKGTTLSAARIYNTPLPDWLGLDDGQLA